MSNLPQINKEEELKICTDIKDYIEVSIKKLENQQYGYGNKLYGYEDRKQSIIRLNEALFWLSKSFQKIKNQS